MKDNNSKELVPVEIDLNPETMDESYLSALGFQMKFVLGALFGNDSVPLRLKGTSSQVTSFARALGNEKRYLQSFEKFGLTDPKTLNNRHKLETAVASFERETGIKWPFK